MGTATPRFRLATAALLWALVAVVLRAWLEATMVGHALVQLPALVVVGALLVSPHPAATAHRFAIPALLVSLFSAAVWMLPRMLDAALSDPTVEASKLVTIPILVGLPLRWSWLRMGGLAKAFVWANLVSMLLTLGWLYKAAPLRICSYYVLAEQQRAGSIYLALALAVTVATLPRLFLGRGANF